MDSIFRIKDFIKRNKSYACLSAVFAGSFAILICAQYFQAGFSRLMSVATYLTWHNLFELITILVSFSIFAVAYFTYDRTRSIKDLFLGSILLLSGLISIFHTLSFKGMPEFFVENTTANRATTFWIIQSLIAGVGILAASFIPKLRKTKIHRSVFIILPLLITALVFYVVTYLPGALPQMYSEGEGLTSAKVVLELLAAVLFLAAAGKNTADYARTGDRLYIRFSSALILLVFSRIGFVAYGEVYDIYNYLGHIYAFIAYFLIFRVVFVSSVQNPYMKLSEAKNELKNYAENLDHIVMQRTQELTQTNQKLLEDLEYARDIQRATLPSVLPSEAGVSFYARYFPAERLSGDFYNVFKLDDAHLGLYIGDVAGHGVAAAMLAVFINQSMNYARENAERRMGISSPSKVLNYVYESFNKTNFKDEVYAVLLYAVYSTVTMKLTYASAGMNVVPLLIRESGDITELAINGFPILKFEGCPRVDYKDVTIKLNCNDKILFYTDGLIDAANMEGERFGEGRLENLLKENASKTGQFLADTIEKQLLKFTAGTNYKDDITYFIMDLSH